MSSYVAITRLTQRKGLLIYRPFARGPYTEGAPLGISLLMQTLRGEHVDWAQIERDHLPKRNCADCGRTKFKPEFGKEWGRKDGGIVCEECAKSMVEGDGREVWCTQCTQRRARPDWHAARGMKSFRVRSCPVCEVQKAQAQETKRAARKAKLGEWNQRQIVAAESAKIPCADCGRSIEKGTFSGEQLQKRAQERRCPECTELRQKRANEGNAVNAGRAEAAAKRELRCASCNAMFPWQLHVSAKQRKHHLTTGARVVCGVCAEKGFTARSWQAFQCTGRCEEWLPRSKFGKEGSHFARSAKSRKLKCDGCRG